MGKDRIVEGVWDCPYCGANDIGGLTKHCPCCGHPQDKGTEFRLGKAKRYLTEEEADKVGTNPDWACDFCQSLNNSRYSYCSNCGAKREAENKDYFELHSESEVQEESSITKSEIQEESSVTKPEIQEEMQEETSTVEHSSKKSSLNSFKRFGSLILCAILVVSLICGLVFAFSPKEYKGVITEKSWQRDIAIEKYKTFTESGWSMPAGGRLLYTNSEIRTYKQVLDHYETKTRQVPHQVLDGYTTTYSNNGNGTFTEHRTPRYRTEYRTETYQDPVYRQEPVYDTKYYYNIDRWVKTRSVKTSGTTDEPYWGTVELKSKERQGSKTESYNVTVSVVKGNGKNKEYTYCSDFDEWKRYEIDSDVKITVVAGMVTEMEVE